MASAFVLVNANTGREKDVLQTLRRISSVSEAHVAYGGFDILAKVEAESSKGAKQIVVSRRRKLENARSTLTLVVVD